MVDHAGQVTVMAPVADLVDADADQPLEPRLIEVVGEDALDDPPDGVPADPEQPGDRCLGHLLGQPRDDVFEVAGVARPRPRPRDRLELRPAAATPQPPQLALDDAAVGAQIEVAPALDAPPVDRQPTGLPAARADPSPAPQPHRHDHPVGGEADVDHRRARQTQKPVECRADTHVALLAGRLTLNSQQPAARAAACRLRSAQAPQESSTANAPAHAVIRQQPSPPNREETPNFDTNSVRLPAQIGGSPSSHVMSSITMWPDVGSRQNRSRLPSDATSMSRGGPERCSPGSSHMLISSLSDSTWQPHCGKSAQCEPSLTRRKSRRSWGSRCSSLCSAMANASSETPASRTGSSSLRRRIAEA